MKTLLQIHLCLTMSIYPVIAVKKISAVWLWNLKDSPFTWYSRRLRAVSVGTWAMWNCRIRRRIHCSSKSIALDCRYLKSCFLPFPQQLKCIKNNFAPGETVNTRSQYTFISDACWQIIHVRWTRYYSILTRKLIQLHPLRQWIKF